MVCITLDNMKYRHFCNYLVESEIVKFEFPLAHTKNQLRIDYNFVTILMICIENSIH